MLYGTVLCSDCAWDHTVVMGCRPKRCPRCRAMRRAQVKADLLHIGRQALVGALSVAAVVGMIAVTLGALTTLAGCL